MLSVFEIIDFIGVSVFAISGVATASEKKLDLFGGFIIAFVTALGGGTLRDLLLNTSIGWIQHPEYIYTVLGATILGILFKKQALQAKKTTFIFDTLGIGLFTVLGVIKGLQHEVPSIVAIMFGVVTATFGGVIRDILCNEIPLIFRKEIYATACLIGATCFVLLSTLEAISETTNILLSSIVIILIRTVAVVKKLSLPIINDRL